MYLLVIFICSNSLVQAHQTLLETLTDLAIKTESTRKVLISKQDEIDGALEDNKDLSSELKTFYGSDTIKATSARKITTNIIEKMEQLKRMLIDMMRFFSESSSKHIDKNYKERCVFIYFIPFIKLMNDTYEKFPSTVKASMVDTNIDTIYSLTFFTFNPIIKLESYTTANYLTLLNYQNKHSQTFIDLNAVCAHILKRMRNANLRLKRINPYISKIVLNTDYKELLLEQISKSLSAFKKNNLIVTNTFKSFSTTKWDVFLNPTSWAELNERARFLTAIDDFVEILLTVEQAAYDTFLYPFRTMQGNIIQLSSQEAQEASRTLKQFLETEDNNFIVPTLPSKANDSKIIKKQSSKKTRTTQRQQKTSIHSVKSISSGTQASIREVAHQATISENLLMPAEPTTYKENPLGDEQNFDIATPTDSVRLINVVSPMQETQVLSSKLEELKTSRQDIEILFNDSLNTLKNSQSQNLSTPLILYSKLNFYLKNVLPHLDDLVLAYEFHDEVMAQYSRLQQGNMNKIREQNNLIIRNPHLVEQFSYYCYTPYRYLKDKITARKVKLFIENLGNSLKIPYSFDTSREGSRIHFELNGVPGSMHIHSIDDHLDSGRLSSLRNFFSKVGLDIND